jgi:hypothetical protein
MFYVFFIVNRERSNVEVAICEHRRNRGVRLSGEPVT